MDSKMSHSNLVNESPATVAAQSPGALLSKCYSAFNSMINKKSIKEISFLWMGSLLGALAAFFSQVIMARGLGPVGFGAFASAYATIMLLVPLAGFGVAQYWLKVYGAEGAEARRWLCGSYWLVFTSAFVVLLLLVAWAFSGLNDAGTRLVLLIMGVYLLGQASIELVSARFQLEEKYLILALWQFLPHLLRLILVAAAAFGTIGLSLMSVANIYAVVSLAFLVTGVFLLLRMWQGRFDLKGHVLDLPGSEATLEPGALSVFSNAWPFGLAAFFHLIYYQSDIIFLKYLIGDHSAGIYNVAFAIMSAVYLLPGVIYQKYLLPKMHRWANHDHEKFFQVYRFGNKAMLLLGVIAMVGLWVTSFWAVPLLFGNEYSDSVVVLNVLALSAPLIFLAFNSGATLVTKDNMLRKVKYMGYVAMINVVLNVFLIPRYAESGAAAATVTSNLILLLFYYVGARKHVFGTTRRPAG